MKKRIIPSLILAGALAPLFHVQAADYVLRASDVGSVSSFVTPFVGSAGGWATAVGGANVGAPTAGNTYTVTIGDLRVPVDSTSYTFAGDSLTLNTGARFILGGATAARTITINDVGGTGGLILNGGQVLSTFNTTLAGNIKLVDGTTSKLTAQSGSLTISSAITGGGAANVTGGYVYFSGVNNYTGGTIVDGAVLTISGAGTLGDSSGSLTVNSGSLNLSTTVNTTVGSLKGTGGTIFGGGGATIFTVNQVTSGTFAGQIRGGSTSFKLGSLSTGTLTLTGTGLNTGTYTVEAGTLIVGNGTSGALNGGGATIVNAGTLGGSRTSGNNFAGAVVIGNNVGTGDAILTGAEIGTAGRNASAGNLTLNSDSKFVFDLVSTAGLVTNDLFVVNGGTGVTTINTGALIEFEFTGDAGALIQGQTFTAIDGGSFAGTAKAFSNLAEGDIISSNGVSLQASYTGGDLVFTVVPEPSSLAMMAGGIGMLLMLRRRQGQR